MRGDFIRDDLPIMTYLSPDKTQSETKRSRSSKKVQYLFHYGAPSLLYKFSVQFI